MSSREYVYQKFAEFYNRPSTVIPAPVGFAQREFAYLLFKEKVMVRHQSFANPKAFNQSIKERICSDIYHSCAYYEFPDADMDKKGWSGADLVFDIDADHIPTSCNKIHDEWRCANPDCGISGGFSGKGITPDMCPVCSGVKFETKTWACDLCIDSTRQETSKLIDMLTNDFGFAEDEIHTFFSGHRGFHIHVENEAVRSLDASSRKEIVDYVLGTGLEMFEKNREPVKRKALAPVFSLGNYGWKRRLKIGMRAFIANATKENLEEIGVSKKSAETIVKKKEAILKRCLEENRWSSVKDVGPGTWKRIAEHVKNQEIAQIDTVVTTDIHRLIRMNGTLHGKTGLLKKEFPISRLDEFDPFVEAVAFKEGEAEISITEAPEFRLGGETFGPYRNQKVRLPTAAAVLVICKGRGELAK